MNLKTPINENYAAVVVEIKSTIALEKCDNVVGTVIFGNHVIVSKDTQAGKKGLFFPVETQLSEDYLKENNLYRINTLNKDINEKGYFEENGRVKCMKFRGHKSEGIFMPFDSLLFAAEAKDLATLKVGDTFDHINGLEICRKYIPKISRTAGTPGSGKQQKKAAKSSRIVEGQFRFHGDTAQLGKNIGAVKPNSIISITNKLHGTSFVVAKIPVYKKLGWFLRLLQWFGVPIVNKEHDIIYSSRKVIKNDDPNKDYNHYYREDVWREVADELKDHLLEGMTIYGEAVGFTPSGQYIQKDYDYGCRVGEDHPERIIGVMQSYIYRITYTNPKGQVFEFSAKQVQDWCKKNGLNAVPEFFYGRAGSIFTLPANPETSSLEQWQEAFLNVLLTEFNMEKDCELCKNKVPAEGIVLRVEGMDYEAYKLKSFRFRERETKELDKGEVDLETMESQEEKE